MIRRQALGWLGAAVCSVALVIAGGLVLSSLAVHRYLQASDSAQQRSQTSAAGETPAASERAAVERTVSALVRMPGVATATSSTDRSDTPAQPGVMSLRSSPSPTTDSTTLSYDVSVIMNPDATAAQCAEVVFTMTQRLQNGRVSLELSLPAGDGHAASVIDYRNVFATPVPRSTVAAVSHAVDVAASVPGVRSVHVVVPYTWNLASGDLEVQMATDDSHQTAQLKDALSRTALADVGWADPSSAPSSMPSPAPTQPSR
ncbi:hypothetical protein [Gryllotalpicola protaetiae]|uniref:Uncharacterized protein n=1 Tax=Gryllotalpicola protaetiae TaxID=2419771 RepID=A0A387BR39_9MICO|nr:hypothetical protein [Gryllotalpicola protaetiae]AYG04554.1 hypothetical protein D7I44_14115 [Gryllotalpicola protaetiae]